MNLHLIKSFIIFLLNIFLHKYIFSYDKQIGNQIVLYETGEKFSVRIFANSNPIYVYKIKVKSDSLLFLLSLSCFDSMHFDSSTNSMEDGNAFAEVINTPAADKKDCLRGTQLTRSLQNVNDLDGPNEEANLRSQNMRITKTTTEYPESKRVVKDL
jgi:hypothetical protein